MAEKPIIVWFRHNLRVADNAALSAAADGGGPVIPVFVLDDVSPGAWAPGGASRWWLHHSLASLGRSLEKMGSPLILRRGSALDVLADLAGETGAAAVHCSRSYEPWAIGLEAKVRARLERLGVALRRYCGELLHEPDRLTTNSGGPFKVYTPFWKALSGRVAIASPRPAPERLVAPEERIKSDDLAAWGLLPSRPDWAKGFSAIWRPGEAGAHERLERFLASGIGSYDTDRNRPDVKGTSGLSPHLHFGEISPRQCWHAAHVREGGTAGSARGLEVFLKELSWREFSYHLLFHWPDLPEKPFRAEFGTFPWRAEPEHLRAWQRGRTGYPIVDAGMRELWGTGWMHNRVRMIVASFLVKDLFIPWQTGEAWFWDTLVDADLASNAASWQWVAGSGADAAPYFRIFNPVSQGQKFDPEGSYVRRWVPELGGLPASVIHEPWTAPPSVLQAAGVELGVTYPKPIVTHKLQREAALAAYGALRARPTA